MKAVARAASRPGGLTGSLILHAATRSISQCNNPGCQDFHRDDERAGIETAMLSFAPGHLITGELAGQGGSSRAPPKTTTRDASS